MLCKCIDQEGNWFLQAAKAFRNELLYKLESLSSRCSNQMGKIILTATQFAGARPCQKCLLMTGYKGKQYPSFWTYSCYKMLLPFTLQSTRQMLVMYKEHF